MRNVVLSSLFVLAALAASNAEAARRISCRDGGGHTVTVDIDVLESNPPQSQVTVKRDGDDWGSYSSFGEYLELESFPVQYQWRFPDHDDKRLLVVSTTQPAGRGLRKARGTYHYNRATSPLQLTCTVQ
jgi:hypothetical protein